MRIIPIAVFTLLFLSIAYGQTTIPLYISNSVSNNPQNGSIDAPWANFSSAFTYNISTAQSPTKFDVIFVGSTTPYPVNFTLEQPNVTALFLTSMSQGNATSPGFSCSSFPTIILEGRGGVFLSNPVIFNITNLNVILANGTNQAFNFAQGLNYDISINNSCLNPNTNMTGAVMFNVKSLGFANIFFVGVNITTTGGNRAQILESTANSQLNVTLDTSVINLVENTNHLKSLFSALGGPGLSLYNSFNIYQVNITGNHYGSYLFEFFHVDNINIYNFIASQFHMNGLSSSTQNSYFRFTAANVIRIENVQAIKSTSHALHMVYIDDIQLRNFTQITIASVNFVQTTNVSLIDTKINEFQLFLSSISVLNSTLAHNPLIFVSSKFNKSPLKTTRYLFNDIFVSRSTISSGFISLKHVDESNQYLEDIIPAYALTILVLNVQNNNITKSPFIDTGGVSLFVESPQFFNNLVESTQMFSASQVLTNLIILNGTFLNENYHQSSLVKTVGMPSADNVNVPTIKLLLYKLVAIMNCKFQNMSIVYTSEFLNTGSPFIIFGGNLLTQVRLYASVLMTTTGISADYSSYSMRNKTMENELYGSNPGVLSAFQSMFSIIPHCASGCYFSAVANNSFDNVYTGAASPENVFEMNVNKDSITRYEFGYNNFVNSIITTNFVKVVKRNDAFNAVQNNFFNVTCNNMFLVQSTGLSFTFNQNLVSVSTFSKVFAIQILTSGSNTTIQSNSIVSTFSNGLFHVVSANNANLTIDSTLYAESVISTTNYSQLTGVYVQLSSDSVNSIVTFSNFFMQSTVLVNKIALSGFYPAIENSFIYIQTFAKSQLYIKNVTLVAITASAVYSSIANFQAGEIYLNTMNTKYVVCNESIGYAYSFQAAIMDFYQYALISNHLAVPNMFVSTHSLVYIGFPYGVNQNLFNFTYMYVQNWNSSTPAFFVDVPAINLYINGFTGNVSGPAWLVASAYANITIIDTEYITKENSFFAMTNQPGYINLTVIDYTESYSKNMVSLSGPGTFSFVIPNKQIQYSYFYTVKIGKVGFFQGSQTSGNLNLYNINLLKQDLTNSPAGFISFVGGCQQVSVNKVQVSNIVAALNQSFINMLASVASGNCVSSVSLTNFNSYQSEFTALVNVQGPSSDIFIQNVSATNSGFSLVNNQQTQATNCVVNISNVNITSHYTNFLAINGAWITILDNVNVSNCEIDATTYVNAASGGYIYIFNSTFSQNVVAYPGTSFMQLSNGHVGMQNVTYYNNSMQIEIANGIAAISNVTANDNGGQNRGAVFYFNGAAFQVENCTFINNTAYSAPVIYANLTNNLSYTINGNVMTGNVNMKNGKAVGGPSNIVKGNLTEIPIRVKHLNSLFDTYLAYSANITNSSFRYTQYNISNVSAFLLNYTELKISLYDFKGQLVSEGDKDFSVSVITNGQTEELETTSTNGVLTLNGSAINLNGSLSTNVLNFVIDYSGEISYLDLNLNLRACLPGEYVDNITNLCVICPAGLYSVDPQYPCHICPEGATCYGGNVVEVDPGFWMFPNTGFILPCPSSGCTGGFDVTSQCAPGYDGGMCLGCNASQLYSQNSAGECTPCSSSTIGLFFLFILKLTCSFIFEIIYIYLVYRANRKVNKMNLEAVLSGVRLRNALDINITGAQIKLFTSYTQYLFIIAFYLRSSFFLDTFSVIYDFLMVSRVTAAPSFIDMKTIECLFLNWGVDPTDLPYDILTFHLYFPVIKLVIYFAGVCFMNSRGKIKDISLLVNTAIVSYLLLEGLAPLQNILQFSVCSMSGYVYGCYSISCSDPQYLSYDYDVGVPVIIFWGIIVPVGLFLVVYRNKHRLHEFTIRNIVGTMTNHYKEGVYYWGFVVLGFKLILILLFTIFLDSQTATSLGFILMMYYYYLSIKYEPFINIELEKQDRICTIVIASTLFLASIAIRTEYEIMEIVPVVLAIVINLGVYVPSIWRIIASYYRVKRSKQREQGLLDKISNDPTEQKMDTMKIT